MRISEMSSPPWVVSFPARRLWRCRPGGCPAGIIPAEPRARTPSGQSARPALSLPKGCRRYFGRNGQIRTLPCRVVYGLNGAGCPARQSAARGSPTSYRFKASSCWLEPKPLRSLRGFVRFQAVLSRPAAAPAGRAGNVSVSPDCRGIPVILFQAPQRRRNVPAGAADIPLPAEAG